MTIDNKLLDEFKRLWDGAQKTQESDISKAVVACSDGTGCILFYKGTAIEQEINAVGKWLEDLGLDNCPDGIWIWEGTYVCTGGSYEYPDDYEVEASGKFREPTGNEWVCIVNNTNPFENTKIVLTDGVDDNKTIKEVLKKNEQLNRSGCSHSQVLSSGKCYYCGELVR